MKLIKKNGKEMDLISVILKVLLLRNTQLDNAENTINSDFHILSNMILIKSISLIHILILTLIY